ncbi:calcium-binding mitochondrial carrier protein SCaMC-2-like isoform X1 [Lates japonicus]|uniref:Calcium-binding mitochondrial carrier protein SCaMC-2-like isoform X1 n=1 Tax=Lates japonicus TaxID=270547 RepID=A0AAD3NLS5_LATJO|nr:calcium-binding mitochondrial carrier protein SCaMC-2-like isoform X1 [Lates japonicus]
MSSKLPQNLTIKFMAYEQIKRLIGSNQETLGITERLVAGSLAGQCRGSIPTPMEHSMVSWPVTHLPVRTEMQAGYPGGPQMNMTGLFRHMGRTEGHGTLRGLAPNFMKVTSQDIQAEEAL